MRERFYSDPRIGQSKNTALEIVTRNRAHFSRELRASRSRSGPTYRAILPVLWRHPMMKRDEITHYKAPLEIELMAAA